MDHFTEMLKVKQRLGEARIEYYSTHVLFEPQWWTLLVIFIAFWFLWAKLHSRNEVRENIIVGLCAGIIATILDDLGTSFGLWAYKYFLIPNTPRLNAVNLSVIPVCYMLIFQWFKPWKSYILSLIILAFGASFISESVLEMVDIYAPFQWKHIYSFPIYILIGVVLKWIVDIISKLAKTN
ncbi:CBO0543 family protein [Bacillus suaedaesalsae]|uniref:Rod shape-determining protein MreD n=1 Tax=Bacillus suaedaesalsae TaxID=2810349 RepID=A0ABS2DJM5_9BACI|nr:CBO0543 family protein [Bacillus suaedaesalsae]MBM6618648.1 hypothetical protein [Bacillus suaedaesalsae]